MPIGTTLENEFAVWRSRVVEVQRGHRTLLRCPVRNRDFNDAPEERIRQGLLHFFVELSKTTSFVLGAEQNRHDVDLRRLPTAHFNPYQPPFIIIETKVDSAAGDDTNRQLKRYIYESDSSCGVVFTGRRMWRLEIIDGDIRSANMVSLTELSELVRELSYREPLADKLVYFEAARAGDLDALKELISSFEFATFVIDIDGREVRCRSPKLLQESLEYRPLDVFERRPLSVSTASVRRLLRVEP